MVRYTAARVTEEPAAFIRGKYNYTSGKAVFKWGTWIFLYCSEQPEFQNFQTAVSCNLILLHFISTVCISPAVTSRITPKPVLPQNFRSSFFVLSILVYMKYEPDQFMTLVLTNVLQFRPIHDQRSHQYVLRSRPIYDIHSYQYVLQYRMVWKAFVTAFV